MTNSLVGRSLGQYKVVAELGQGQHSAVYKAWQQSLERHVALKVLRHYDDATLRQFQAEARLTARLIEDGVPNIRRVYEVAQTRDGYLYVSQEYVESSLQGILRRATERGQRIHVGAAADLLQPVALALDALHRLGWVHLDIKPQNILISSGGRAVLADFGIAQRQGTLTHACTPAYASPEQAAGDRPVGPWSDIYSLGVTLYEIAAGRPPVRGDLDIVLLNQHLEVNPTSPRDFNPGLLPRQEKAILKALDKAPKNRQSSAGELVKEVRQPTASEAGSVKTPSRFAGGPPGPTRRISRPVLAGAIAVALLAILLVAAVTMLSGWPVAPRGGDSAATATATPTLTASPASSTRAPVATSRPASTSVPTATLAPTFTRVPRPTATPAPSATP